MRAPSFDGRLGTIMHSLGFLGLTKAYGGVPALRDVSLTLHPGRVHALMGENGAGKSTLIKLIAGVVPADRMVVQRDGQAITLRSAADATRAGFRFIHQELNIVPQLTVAENVLLGHAAPRRLGAFIDWPRLQAKAQAALAFLGAGHIDVRQQAGALGTGDRMLARIASALVADAGAAEPCLYVFDEPTAALTAAESSKLFDVIARLKARGAAVLYVSHRMNEVMQICDDVTVLRDGRHVLTTEIAQTNRDAIIAAMTGKATSDTIPPRTTPVGLRVAACAAGLATRDLSGLNLTLAEGEILGVAGLEEAGQTAFLHMFLGQGQIRDGQLQVLGAPVPRNPAAAWARGVAYVPRERRSEGLMLGMGVRPNALFPHLGDSGLIARKGTEVARTRSLADQVRLRFQGTEQPVGQLSGGNQHKVVFARAMAGQPKLLLLEEPTRGVDVGARAELHALIRTLSSNGTAVILASSDLTELLGLSDRILILHGGRQVALLDRGGMTPADLLSRIYAPEAA
ncbi:MAG: sugar ABC transporter ATP-binding protein [Paracoccaceae bacterium]